MHVEGEDNDTLYTGTWFVVCDSSLTCSCAWYGGCVLVVLGSSECVPVVLGSSECVPVVLGSSGCVLVVLGSSECVLVVLGSSECVPVVLGSSGCVQVVLGSSGCRSSRLGSTHHRWLIHSDSSSYLSSSPCHMKWLVAAEFWKKDV